MAFRSTTLMVLVAALLLGCGDPPGYGRGEVALGGERITVFTHHPPDCTPTGLILVFHGMSRNAADYRDHARPLAEHHCLIIVAPEYDAERFSIWRYHGGGLINADGPRPESEWTVFGVTDLMTWSRTQAGKSALPVRLFGHSAGAQFLGRVAAFGTPDPAARIVLSNASTYVFPTVEAPVPFGFGGLPAVRAEALLRAYISRPVTLYLGGADTGTDNLYQGPEGQRQGANRLERGRALFRAVRAAAAQRGMETPWMLVEAPGIGHSARRMLAAPQAADAFTLPDHPRD